MNLSVHHIGSGPELVMLHGWGLHGMVFDTLAERLSSRFRISLIDLPGHGHSPPLPHAFDLHDLSDAVAAAAPARATWLGWSLGGMVATQLALSAPSRVEKLILVTSSPRFSTADDWPCAMDSAILDGFAQALRDDYRATLDRFLSLQIASGSSTERQTLRRLRETVQHYPMPTEQALRDGLAILRSADLRNQLAGLSQSVLLILGERDRLVPAAIAPQITKLLPSARIDIIKGAGHAPFLSHPQDFQKSLDAFVQEHHD